MSLPCQASVMPSRWTAVTCNDAPQITNYNCRINAGQPMLIILRARPGQDHAGRGQAPWNETRVNPATRPGAG
jgi:hypothetical protein